MPPPTPRAPAAFHHPPQCLVARARLPEKRLALSGRSMSRRAVIESLHLRPAITVHSVSAAIPQQPRLQQLQSRITVSGDTSESRIRRLLDAQPAEEPQLDDPALALVDLRQRLQRFVNNRKSWSRPPTTGRPSSNVTTGGLPATRNTRYAFERVVDRSLHETR